MSFYDLMFRSQARLQVRGLNGAVVTKVYHEDDDENEDQGSDHMTGDHMTGDVPIGDLHTSNTKQILIEMELAVSAGAGDNVPPPADIAEIMLTYTQPNYANHTCTAADATGETSNATAGTGAEAKAVVKTTLKMAFTNDREALGEEDGDVAAAHMIQTTATTDSEVMGLVSCNQVMMTSLMVPNIVI